MIQHKNSSPRPFSLGAGAVWVIGTVSIALAGALQLVGWVDDWNQGLSRMIGGMMKESFGQHLPTWSWWLVAVLMAYGLPALLLPIACGWRRWTVWLVASGLMVLWAPVLGLASHRPDLVVPWVVTVCSGLLTLLCAGGGRCGGNDAD